MMRSALAVLMLLLCAPAGADAQASPFLPVDANLAPYVEHLIRAGVIRDPDPLTRPLRQADVLAELRRADTARAGAAVRLTVRRLSDRLTYDDAEPNFRGRWYANTTSATHARRDPLREAGPGYTTAGGGMHLTAHFGPLAASQHVIIDPNIRHDPDYSGRTDDSLPFPVFFNDAYISLQGRYGGLFLGAMQRNWGPTGVPGEMTSPEPYPYTHIAGRVGGARLRLEGLYTELDAARGPAGIPLRRHWATHRIVLSPVPAVTLVITSGTLWYGQGRGAELRWLNPVLFSAISRWQDDLGDSANVMHGGQIRLELPRRMVFQGALLLDDYNNSLISGSVRYAPARIIGTSVLDVPVSPGLALRGVFTGVSSLAYRAPFGPQESVMWNDVGLGRNFADYTLLTVSASVVPHPLVVLMPEVSLLNQGEGDFRDPFPNPANTHPFLYEGVVERTVRLGLGGQILAGRHLDVSGDAGVHFVSNRGHVAGAGATRVVARLRVRLETSGRVPLF